MKILNFGSMNTDYVYHLPHFVRPGETVSDTAHTVHPGGKGLNQSVAMARAGLLVFHAGTVGKGSDMLLETLKSAGVNTRYIQKVDSPGGHTVVQVTPSGENCIIVHGGANRLQTRDYIDIVLGNFKEGDLLVLQNEINELAYLIDTAYDRGMQILLNPSPFDTSILKLPLSKVTYFVLNELEGAVISGTGNTEQMVGAILKKYAHARVLLTLGERGAYYWDGSALYKQSVMPSRPVDTTAAGDTFLGYFIHGIKEGLPIAETLWNAAKAASIAVSREGAADSIPVMDEVVK